MDATLVVLVVLAGLAYAWMNGMHDAANAVAASLSTGALTPRAALPMSAVLNLVGALMGVQLAQVFGTHLATVPVHRPGPALILTALLTALAWNTLTWWFGLPSSSSHALIGSLAGAGFALGDRVDWHLLAVWLALPLVLSPVLGFIGAWLVMAILLRLLRDAAHERAIRGFRMAQSVTAATMSLGHGLQDGQKTMGVIMLALGAGVGLGSDQLWVTSTDPSPLGLSAWVQLAVGVSLALGTLAGGWRIIRTLSRRIVRMTPATGFAAESVASSVLYASAALVGVPVSSTHTVTAAIIGAGSTAGLRAIRWGTVRQILIAWLLTPVVTFLLAAAVALVLSRIGR